VNPMILRILAGAVLCLLAASVAGQETRPASLATWDEARGWEGVGRVDVTGKGFCTGALVSPALVVTAAHCLFDRQTGQPVDPSRIEFLAGWRNGRAAAYRGVRQFVIHPDYRYAARTEVGGMASDLALIELDRPIRNTTVHPYPVTDLLYASGEVGVVSYAADRAEAASLQEVCTVLGIDAGLFIMSCDIDFGSSGAPVFLMSPEGPRIVSVVSAKADLAGEKVAIGATLSGPLELLRAELGRTAGVVLGGAAGPGGAKFVRP